MSSFGRSNWFSSAEPTEQRSTAARARLSSQSPLSLAVLVRRPTTLQQTDMVRIDRLPSQLTVAVFNLCL